jgi:AcrR family transcriptional regulator
MNNYTPPPELLAHAEALFSQHGYPATSPQAIAEAAGIISNPTSVDKEALLWASALRIAEAFETALTNALSTPRPLDERLRYAMIAHISVITENLTAANVYMHEWRFLSEDRLKAYKSRRDAYEAHFREIIREGIYAGIFAPVDEKLVALMVLSALNWVSQWYHPDGGMTATEIAQTLANLTLNGLYRQA